MVDEPLDDDEEDGDANDDVSLKPNENADPQEIVDREVPQSIRDRYEVFSYRNAAVILAETKQTEFAEIVSALDAFKITTEMIRTAGGNESDICACRKLNPGILVMQSAQGWATKNVPGAVDGARDRCIFLQG
jgi:hypothetical protein